MKTAVVTGASSGLGREYVRRIASCEREIEEIWVIARRKERLEEVRSNVREINQELHVCVLPMDLTQEKELDRLEEKMYREKPEIRILINAAGFGKVGNYAEIGRKESGAMIDLNCRAAVEVTQICLPYMGKGSRILQICLQPTFVIIHVHSPAPHPNFLKTLRPEKPQTITR